MKVKKLTLATCTMLLSLNVWAQKTVTVDLGNGAKYEGQLVNGTVQGHGTMTYSSGDKYVGEWKDNMQNGQGTYTFADGRKYVGKFKDDQYNGQGTFTWPDGRKYIGEFKDGKFCGKGTVTFADGIKYVGEFKDSKFQGTMTYADGRVENGLWDDDQLVGNGQSDEIFTQVDQMPQFNGDLVQWLSTNRRYPPEARKEGIQGRVVCSFVVEKDGSISNVNLVRAVHPALDKEVCRMIYAMPKWIPGKNKGQLARVKFNLPVTFKL